MGKEYPPDYNQIPLSERLSLVVQISDTIPMERIKFRKSGNQINEIWGFVLLNGLPFCFRAWPSFLSQRELAFLRPERGRDVYRTNWSPHAPYNPLDFHPPIFAGEISKDDKVYLLRQLGVEETDIKNVAVKGEDELNSLYRSSLSGEKDKYSKCYHLYSADPILSAAFGAAVSLKCDEVEKALKEGTLQQQGV